MTSFAGRRAASRVALACALAAPLRASAQCDGDGQPTTLMPSVAFDSIFYRGASGLGNCYVLDGNVGYSLRPVDPAIHHGASQTCASCMSGVAKGSQQEAALADCPTGGCCHADCTAFARKAQHALKTSDPLRTVEKPGPCSGVDCSSGTRRVAFPADTRRDEKSDVARLRPGDDCESAEHTVLLVRRNSGNDWTTLEARGHDYGVMQWHRDVSTEMLHGKTCGKCDNIPGCWPCANNTNGCWRPVTERTAAPDPTKMAMFIPGTGGASDTKVAPGGTVSSTDANNLVLKWEAPPHFAALANYLVWIQWTDNGVTSNRLFRVPAFAKRWMAPAQRLVDFPNASGTMMINGVAMPVPVPMDDTEASVLRVPLNRITQLVEPQQFKDPNNQMKPAGTFGSGLVPCVPTLPVVRADEAVCDNKSFKPAETSWGALLPGQQPRTFNVRVRVERYAMLDDDPTRFAARTVVGACPKVNNGFDPDCLDPQWSMPLTFTVMPAPVACQEIYEASKPSFAECDIGPGTWVIDPNSIQGGCLHGGCQFGNASLTGFGFSLQFDACDPTQPIGNCTATPVITTCAVGFDLTNFNCGGSDGGCAPMTCQDAPAVMKQACMTSSCGCDQGYPFHGPGMIFMSPLTVSCPDGPQNPVGTIQFTLVSCDAPGNQSLPGCH